MENIDDFLSGFKIKVMMNPLLKTGDAVLMLSKKDYAECANKEKEEMNYCIGKCGHPVQIKGDYCGECHP